MSYVFLIGFYFRIIIIGSLCVIMLTNGEFEDSLIENSDTSISSDNGKKHTVNFIVRVLMLGCDGLAYFMESYSKRL